jgi:signal transduction histidine kinase
MRRLYLRIYLAVLASLVVFALVAGGLWRLLGDGGPRRYGFEVAGVLAQNVLPPAGAAPAEQQAALEKLAANLRADVGLFAADRALLASVGAPVPPPSSDRERGGWLRGWGPPAGVIHLRDGRFLVARIRGEHRPSGAPLFGALGLIALAVAVGAYPVVRRLTARLERLQAGVESLGAGNLSARVRVEGRDEVAALAESFNRAAARIEELMAAHKTLLANASHELRTPLTRIRMAVELAKSSVDRERRRALERDIAELDELIDEILLASRLDASPERDVDENVDLLALATEECARFEHARVDGQPATVRGDPRLLRRMVRNLLENARRHGAPPVDVSIRQTESAVELMVCDRGEGIPDADRDDVFQPFRRVGTRSAGAGLGLSLVRQIARRHGGDARYLGRTGATSCFSVTLPASSPGGSTAPSGRAGDSERST